LVKRCGGVSVEIILDEHAAGLHLLKGFDLRLGQLFV
jgi:hypothetical protein